MAHIYISGTMHEIPFIVISFITAIVNKDPLGDEYGVN